MNEILEYREYFKEDILGEIFNTIYPYRHEVNNRYGNVYRFKTPGGEEYEVFLNDRDRDDLKSEYSDNVVSRIYDKDTEDFKLEYPDGLDDRRWVCGQVAY